MEPGTYLPGSESAELLDLSFDDRMSTAQVLNRIPFVEWDRAGGRTDWYGVFGWIKRPEGGRDFVEVIFNHGAPVSFGTSSAEYSVRIDRILWPDRNAAGHSSCIPVSDLFQHAVRNLAPWQRGGGH